MYCSEVFHIHRSPEGISQNISNISICVCCWSDVPLCFLLWQQSGFRCSADLNTNERGQGVSLGCRHATCLLSKWKSAWLFVNRCALMCPGLATPTKKTKDPNLISPCLFLSLSTPVSVSFSAVLPQCIFHRPSGCTRLACGHLAIAQRIQGLVQQRKCMFIYGWIRYYSDSPDGN